MGNADRFDGRLDDLLAAYELDLLDDDDRARFEAAALTDPDLLEELFDAAPTTSALLSEPARYADAAREGLTAASPSRGRRWWQALSRPRVLATTVAVAAAMVLVFWPGGDSTDLARLASVERLPVTRLDLRAASPAADTAYSTALDLYDAEQWRDAANQLASAIDLGGPSWPRRRQAQLYQGSALLLAAAPQEAVPALTSAATSPLAPVRERAAWQLVQAHLQLNDLAEARAVLATLKESPVLGERTADLLETLADD